MQQKIGHLVKLSVPLVSSSFTVALTAIHPAFAQSGVSANDFNGLGLGLFHGTLFQALAQIINFLLLVGGIVAFLFALYGGFVYLTAGGNAAQTTTGRTIIVNAIIGIIIIFISLALLRYIIGFTQPSTNTNLLNGFNPAATRSIG